MNLLYSYKNEYKKLIQIFIYAYKYLIPEHFTICINTTTLFLIRKCSLWDAILANELSPSIGNLFSQFEYEM